MKLKQLESMLSEVNPDFEKPKVDLEQVSTSPHIASRMIFTAANTYDDIEGCSVGDFGVGPGVLSLGAHAMGAAYVCGFDCDQDALDLASINFASFDVQDIGLVRVDVQSLSLASDFDTVLMNPPFGTRNTGIDTVFLNKAMAHSNAVYSLHKTSTRDHFVRIAEARGWKLEVLAELRYDLPKMHKHHKQKSKDIEVDLLRFHHVA
jgi:predicted RNA methylase